MKISNLAIALFTASTFATSSFAQNRDLVDKVFTEPNEAAGTQVLLGTIEFLAAEKIYPPLSKEQVAIKEAELALQSARDRAHNARHRQEIIEAIKKDPANYVSDGMFSKQLRLNARLRIFSLAAYPYITPVEKFAVIKMAESNLAKAREAGLMAAQQMGFISKAVYIIRSTTGVFLALDVGARILVWNLLEADPTVSPIGSYLNHRLNE